ncbi:MAG: hypothetical protein R3B90_05245 [Planctomycetaceae bacterium]
MTTSEPSRQILDSLARQLRQLDGGRPLLSSSAARLRSTGLRTLDQLLPERGVPAGTLIECLVDGNGSGGASLALLALARLLPERGGGIVIDPERTFYPLGLHGPRGQLEQLIVVHPNGPNETLWALEQSLRCSAAAVVVGWIDRLHPHAYRRLKLAAETGGGLGWLLRSDRYRTQPSWADIRLRIRPLARGTPHTLSSTTAHSDATPSTPADRTGRAEPQQAGQRGEAHRNTLAPPERSDSTHAVWRLQLELLACRGGLGTVVAEQEWDDETGDLRLVSGVARAAGQSHAARA